MTASPVHADPLVEVAAEAMFKADPYYQGTGVDAALWTWDVIDPDTQRYWRRKAAVALTALQARLATPEGATGELVRKLQMPVRSGGTNSEDAWESYDELRLEAASTIAAQEREIVALREVARACEACVESLKLVAREITKSPTGEFERWSHPANSIRMAEAALSAARQAPHGEGGAI